MAIVIFMAEIGCILRSACLVSQYGKSTVFFGTLIGTAMAIGVGVYAGEWTARILPHGTMHWIAGFILILVGALMMFHNHNCGSH